MEPTEQYIIETFRRLFPVSRRPQVFMDRNHCEECAEHDDTLQSVDPETISFDEIGNPCWDPICFVNIEGFKYFIPGLTRLALDVSDDNYYLGQFVFHLSTERIDSLSEQQREAIHDLLCYIRLRHKIAITDNFDLDNISKKIRQLNQQPNKTLHPTASS